MTESVLNVEEARKVFGRNIALDGTTLHLKKGEWLGLLGPNGAGKTTLVKAISGRAKLDSGTINLLGASLIEGTGDAVVEARSRMGIVPQEVALYPLLTAKENLEVFGSLCGLAGGTLKERTNWALEFTGLQDRATHKVKGFSGGMKRRLNIAAGVMHKPDVILLDEPTVGVDPQSRERIWQMLTQLKDEGASLLLTSHQLDEVERVCERIVIIDQGKVIAEGTVQELIEKTIGAARRVTLTLDSVLSGNIDGLSFEVSEEKAICTVEQVADELPAILNSLKKIGHRVEDVHIQTPTLQAVFIHLTGRELRES